MAKMINKTFYAGPMLFGTNVLVGNHLHGRTGKAFIKNIHVSNVPINPAVDKGFGSASPVIFGIESDEKPAKYPCVFRSSSAIRDTTYAGFSGVFPKDVYDSNMGESKWGYWAGSHTSRNRHLGESIQSGAHPQRFVIDPRDEEYQFHWDFAKQEDRDAWLRDNGDAIPHADENSIVPSSGWRIEADISVKLAAILAANPSKKLRASVIEISMSPNTSTSFTNIVLGLGTDANTGSTMAKSLCGSEIAPHVYGNSSHCSLAHESMVYSKLTPPLDGDESKMAFYYTGSAQAKIYGIRVALIMEDALEAEPMFVSAMTKLPGFDMIKSLSATPSDYPLYICMGQDASAASFESNLTYEGGFLPELELQFSNDAGATWTAWVSNYTADKFVAISELKQTCNMYYRWRFKALNNGVTPSTIERTFLTSGRYSSKSNISEDLLGKFLPSSWAKMAYVSLGEDAYQLCYYGAALNEAYFLRTNQIDLSADFKNLSSSTPTEVLRLMPSENLGSVSYDLNLPIEINEQFYMTFLIQSMMKFGANTKYHTHGAPSYYLPHRPGFTETTVSGNPYVIITGYIEEE